MKQYVQNLKAKPEHVRKRIAVGASGAVTAVIALAWFGTLAATGAFSLSNGVVADAEPASVAFTNTNVQSNWSQLLGAVGAVTGASSTPELTIVEGETSSTFTRTETAPSPSATVIPF